MPTTTSRGSNGSRRERILKYLSSQGGRIDSADGRGLTSKMAARVGYDNIAALNAILARLERDGEIKRVVRGKRTYSIALRSPASRPARPRGGATKARTGTRKATRTRAGRAPAGRARTRTRTATRAGARAGTRTAARTATRTTARKATRSSPGRARTATRKASRTPAGRAVAVSGARRGSARSGQSRSRRQPARAASAATNLPQLLTALGNELLALREQHQDISRRLAALESAARPATRRASGRRAA
jgi:hypothetical protein